MKNKKDVMRTSYYLWLLDIINPSTRKGNYILLMRDLYKKKFSWFVPNDDNRAFEARNLRERFCHEEQLVYNFDEFDTDVSMLELIVSLAFRCDSIMTGNEQNLSIRGWFWKLLENVELDKFTDEMYYDMDGDVLISQILDNIINRTYSRSGKGGLFPLKNAKKDQRKVELWYQMCHNLVENYYIEDLVI